jgi:hypothetical protein
MTDQVYHDMTHDRRSEAESVGRKPEPSAYSRACTVATEFPAVPPESLQSLRSFAAMGFTLGFVIPV